MSDYWVEVCAACRTANCWNQQIPRCDFGGNSAKLRASTLDELRLERAWNYSRRRLVELGASVVDIEPCIVECADALTWLGSLVDGSVDLVITDPPYESLEKHRAKGTTTRLKQSKSSSNRWFPIFPNAQFPALFAELYRVLRSDAHFYMFCDAETAFVAKPMAEATGFKFWKPLVWDKVNIGMGYHYRARYEFILFFEKGKRKLHDLGVSDVITSKRLHNAEWPTQKPVDVCEVLVKQSSGEHGLVIDPFMGAGTTGIAARLHNRRFAGCDIEADAVTLAKRLLVAVDQPGEYERLIANTCSPEESKRRMDSACAKLDAMGLR